MKQEKFRKGLRVVYVPTHAHNDLTHPDCEHGVVSSTNDKFVFVKFDIIQRRMDGPDGVFKMMTGDEDYTAKACSPINLFLKDEFDFINGV